jgi:phosphonate metabolism protein (transferase hexapeptide repeat family)
MHKINNLLVDSDVRQKFNPMSSEPQAIGKDSSIKNSQFGYACAIGNRCKIANSCFDNYSYIDDDSDVINTSIGKFCSIAAKVRLNPGNHPLERVALHHFTYRASSYGFGEDEPEFFERRASQAVTIGHDVWLGHGVVVLAGVTIGNGAAIGAGTIVTKDVAPYSIVVGNPGREIRKRFEPSIINGLEHLAWWDWPATLLSERINDFRQLEPETFIEKYTS